MIRNIYGDKKDKQHSLTHFRFFSLYFINLLRIIFKLRERQVFTHVLKKYNKTRNNCVKRN